MNSLLIITIILAVLIVFAVFFILKKLMKIAIICAVIFAVLFFVTNGNINKDFSSIKESIDREETIIVLVDGSTVLSSLKVGQAISAINLEEYEGTKGTTLYRFKTSVFREIESVEINNKEVSSEKLRTFYEDGKQISSITYEDLELEVDLEDDLPITDALFAYLYETELKISRSPLFFFTQYKEGNIEVEPETVFFQFTKVVPLSWVEEKINKLKERVVDSLESKKEE